jgi:hypothetical protein
MDRRFINWFHENAVHFATSKIPVVKSAVFRHCNIYKCSWTSNGKTQSYIDHICIIRRQHSCVLDVQSFIAVILITVWWSQK